MALHDDLESAWICFRWAITTYCETDNAYQRGLSATEAEVYLRRMRGMVAEIPPNVHPVYMYHLRSFLDSWEAEPARMLSGGWNGREQLHLNFLMLQANEVEEAIRKVGENREPDPAPPLPYLEKDDVVILESLARRKGIVAFQADITEVSRDRASERLSYLAEVGYVQNPPGNRKRGWLITESGLSRLSDLPAI